MPDMAAGIKRIVFKEIVEGDLRKFEAQSNDADTGGGARDLRFRPFEEFQTIFSALFPNTRIETRRRGGAAANVEVLVGAFHWLDEAQLRQSREAIFEPPTDPRPGEGRIPMVHKYPPFNRLPPTNEGRMVLLLIQRDDDTVWPEFATENSLRSGDWAVSVSEPILRSLEAQRNTHSVARGYIDYVTGREYSDA